MLAGKPSRLLLTVGALFALVVLLFAMLSNVFERRRNATILRHAEEEASAHMDELRSHVQSLDNCGRHRDDDAGVYRNLRSRGFPSQVCECDDQGCCRCY